MKDDEKQNDPFSTLPSNLPAVAENDDEDEFDDLEPKRGLLARFGKAVAITVGLAILCAGAFYLGSSYSKAKDATKDPNEISGQTVESSGAMSESKLRDVVKSTNLIAYWAGPLPGYKYAIFVPKKGVVVIRYLPDGKGLGDSAPKYRVIGTYVQKDATQAVVSSGKKEGSLGFTNIDGNAVFYVRSRPTNVYMAIKDKDIQVEIFDPGQDQAVALALFKGQIQQIK